MAHGTAVIPSHFQFQEHELLLQLLLRGRL